jgi:hypothetical protein
MKYIFAKKIYGLLALLTSTFLMTSCGSFSSLIGQGASNMSGKAIGYEGPRTFVEAKAGSMKIGSGVIDSDGTFNLKLDDSVTDSLLVAFYKDIEKVCPELKISAPEAKLFSMMGPSVAGSIATLFQASWNPNDKTWPEEIALNQRTYVDRDLTVMGTCLSDGGGGTTPYPQEYALNLKKGWNVITLKAQLKNNEFVKASLSSDNPSGLNWYYYPSNTLTLPNN